MDAGEFNKAYAHFVAAVLLRDSPTIQEQVVKNRWHLRQIESFLKAARQLENVGLHAQGIQQYFMAIQLLQDLDKLQPRQESVRHQLLSVHAARANLLDNRLNRPAEAAVDWEQSAGMRSGQSV